MSVHRLTLAETVPEASVIDELERALELAREGVLRTVLIAGEMTEGRTFTAYSIDDLTNAAGMVSLLLHKLNRLQADNVIESGGS